MKALGCVCLRWATGNELDHILDVALYVAQDNISAGGYYFIVPFSSIVSTFQLLQVTSPFVRSKNHFDGHSTVSPLTYSSPRREYKWKALLRSQISVIGISEQTFYVSTPRYFAFHLAMHKRKVTFWVWQGAMHNPTAFHRIISNDKRAFFDTLSTKCLIHH